jgi:hypothetical protein
MQKTTKISFVIIAMLIGMVGLAVASPALFAQTSSGSYDPQKQFPVGMQFTFTSFNGAATQVVGFNVTEEKPILTSYQANAVITVKVDRLTPDGGVHWKVLGGSFLINGQTYTITSGDGHMGKFDRVTSGMDGLATGPNGQTFYWHLEGLSGVYNGTAIIVGLDGSIATVQNGATTEYRLDFLCTQA